MGLRRCVVDGCKSVSGQQQHQGVKFHSFPSNDDVRKSWLENCRLPTNKGINKGTLVCSRHFRRADFQQAKNNKHLLKPGAVPSIFSWGNASHHEMKSVSKTGDAGTVDTTKDAPNISSARSTAATKKNHPRAKSMGNVDANTKQRSASAEEKNCVNKVKADKAIARKSLDSATSSGASKAENTQPNVALAGKTAILMSKLVSGAKLQAQDFNGVWHHANVVEVDHSEQEVLINFEKNKSKGPA